MKISKKKTNGVTWAEVNTAWEKVAQEFNSQCNGPRSKEFLKRLHENKKLEMRKIAVYNKPLTAIGEVSLPPT